MTVSSERASNRYQNGRFRDHISSYLNRRTQALAAALIFGILLLFWYAGSHPSSDPRDPLGPPLNRFTGSSNHGFNGTWDYHRDRDNLLLTLDQCDRAFPGFFVEVDRAVDVWRSARIKEADVDAIPRQNGFVRAMIYDNKLYVVGKTGGIYSRELATLHAIHRAILTSPEVLPNIEFAFNADDRIPSVPLWGYARRAEDTHIWLIPDFGYYSWPETKVGTMGEVRMKAEMEEQSGSWAWKQKHPQLLWRGATMGLSLRERLIDVTRDKPWADVKSLDWHNKESMSNDLKSMPEHCQYKYLMQTEGNSYSGRLKYLQNCRSVVVSHPLDWIEHHHPLMRSSGPDQNFVEVERSFSNLEDTILSLESDNVRAEKIAENSKRTFREHFLTPAAEACYWRKLIHGWSTVSWEPQFWKTDENGNKVWRGLPVESFLLERRLEWEPY